MTAPITRPVLRWFGGKYRLAPWIIENLPSHRVYCEPFGGAASVLLRKPRAYAEVYNDLDADVVGLFRVLRDPDRAELLIEAIRLTPFARAEFELAYIDTEDPIEQARRLVVRSYMGFGANAHALDGAGHRSTGFRASSNRSGTTPAHDWARYPDALRAVVERLAGVVIERRDALEVMAQQDSPATLHYVDPPYVHATRGVGNPYDGSRRFYRHELTDDGHEALLVFLRGLAGMVVLSGYPHALYDRVLADWRRLTKKAFADGARERLEVLWINPAAAAALDRERAAGPLFA